MSSSSLTPAEIMTELELEESDTPIDAYLETLSDEELKELAIQLQIVLTETKRIVLSRNIIEASAEDFIDNRLA